MPSIRLEKKKNKATVCIKNRLDRMYEHFNFNIGETKIDKDFHRKEIKWSRKLRFVHQTLVVNDYGPN